MKQIALIVLSVLAVSPLHAEPGREPLVDLVRVVGGAPEKALTPEQTAAVGGRAPTASTEVMAATREEATFAVVGRLIDAVEAWHAWGRDAGRHSSILFGIPEPGRVEAARHAAREVAALAAAATSAIDRAVEAADRAAADGDDPGAALDDALHARQVVLPLRAARAALLLAACEQDEKRRVNLAAWARALTQRVEAVSAWAATERHTISGLALVYGGEADKAGAEFEAARRAVRAKDAPESLLTPVTIETDLGETLAVLEMRGPAAGREFLQKKVAGAPYVEDGKRALVLGLVVCDLFLRMAHEDAASKRAEQARSMLVRGIERYQELASGLSIEEREHVYRRVARLAHAGEFKGAETAFVLVARAHEARWHEAFRVPEILAPVLVDRPESLGVFGADAMYLFVTVCSQSEAIKQLERVVAVGLLFVEKFGHDPRAAEVLGRTAEASRGALSWAFENDGNYQAAEWDYLGVLLRVYASTLDVPDCERWALTLAQLRLVIQGSRDPHQVIESWRWSESVLDSIVQETAEADMKRMSFRRFLMDVLESAEIDSAANEVMTSADAAKLLLTAADTAARTIPSERRNAFNRNMALVYRGLALLSLGRFDEAKQAVEPIAPVGVSQNGDLFSAGEAWEVMTRAEIGLRNERAALNALTLWQEWARGLSDALESDLVREGVESFEARTWLVLEPLTRRFIDQEEGPFRAANPVVFVVARDLCAAASPARLQVGTRLAWTLLLDGQASRAADEFVALIEETGATADLLRGLGEARLAAGESEAAYSAFRELAHGLEARGEFSRDYFHAWTRMLEILAARPDAKAAAESIRREIARLRAMPEIAEATECAERLGNLAARLSR